PVRLKDLDINNRICTICKLEYCDTKDLAETVDPVKTICGHVFCQKCIIMWLSPLDFEGSTEGASSLSSRTDGAYDEGSTKDTNFLSSGADNEYCEEPRNSCPICQNVFFPKVDYSEPIEGLATRVWLWDTAYAIARVARSEKEEYTRNNLWRYLDYCLVSYTFEKNDDVEVESLRSGQRDVLYFAHKLKTQSLTPVQEGLRKSLEDLSKTDPADNVFYRYYKDPMLGSGF
ncbi:hypothetical protein MMC22_010163, partial [Lobaria immixta]|nr:hypothetical protein [Lobaria immixta]